MTCGKCAAGHVLTRFDTGGHVLEPRDGYGVAVDIGTTTVVMALLSLSTGAVAARHSFINPQRAFGPDVISRIDAANRGHLEELRRLITDSIASGLETLLASRGLSRAEEMTAAGNTVMSYLLLGLPCGSLGAAPFKPAYALEDRYNLFGLPVTVVPWLSAFVGGDIAAGMLHVLPEGARRFMLTDLGTNGETALFDGGNLTVTSAAAGPVFEGGPGGASGVIRELARLVRDGVIDETGLLTGEAPFSQAEIRRLQLAKSAVRSGMEILLETRGLTYEELDTVYLAGGIGQAMDAGDAAAIGLIPAPLAAKARAAGNAALGGAARLLLAPKAAGKDLKALLTAVEEINLASHPRFGGKFMDYMTF
jgi:uncharacterized 2Fe-2S/4Fe-4S cluster protein (DUF4445 family)